MLTAAIPHRPTFEWAVEHVRRAAKSLRVHSERALRRQLTAAIPRKHELDHLVDEQLGYAKLPFGTIPAVAPAIKLAQRILGENRNMEWPENKRQLMVISQPNQYEDAPEFFDLALSDEVLQIASEYLGEVPRALRIKLWWTPVNTKLTGSQLYHRDGMNWLQRQAKFLFIMNDVDANCGPFTFLPADISMKVASSLGSIREQERVSDELVYHHANQGDAISLVGPAGTGAVVDTSRCFHFGARARGGERLMLMFSFMGSVDAYSSGGLRRSPGFEQRFGDDPVRKLVVTRAK
jgi:hypothetical protein